jgi:ribonucleoside-triphosphate reductase
MDLAVQAHLQKKEKTQEMLDEPGRPLYQIGKEAADGKPYVELEKCTYILGLIGLNEVVQYLTGHQLHEGEQYRDIGLRFIAHMYLRTKMYAKKYGLKFSLEESPAESASRRLAKSDLQFYKNEATPIVKGSPIDDSEYYTNSVHLTADADVSITERIRLQSQFHSMIESGAITHAFVGEEQPPSESIAKLVTETFHRTQSAQLTISPEFTYCSTCGHCDRGLKEICVRCGSEEVIGETRVVGYFSKVQNWNKSKRYGELKARQQGNYMVNHETAEMETAQLVTA